MGLTIVATLVSALWLGLCGWYVERTIGIDGLGLLMAHEMSQILSGIFLPLAFLWVLIGYFSLAGRVRTLERGALSKPSARSEPRVAGRARFDEDDGDSVPTLKIATDRDAG